MGTRNISVTDRGLARTPWTSAHCSLTNAPFGEFVATRHRYESQRDNSCLITAVISVGHESPAYTGLISIEESIEEKDISNCSLVVENWHQTRTLLAWLFPMEFGEIFRLSVVLKTPQTSGHPFAMDLCKDIFCKDLREFCHNFVSSSLETTPTNFTTYKDLHPIESNDHR